LMAEGLIRASFDNVRVYGPPDTKKPSYVCVKDGTCCILYNELGNFPRRCAANEAFQPFSVIFNQ
jgi:hypothetical protein